MPPACRTYTRCTCVPRSRPLWAEIMELLVNRIQRYCLHDGPGIRTTVFLQGCPIRCWWCHNPETRAKTSADARLYEVTELAPVLERDARYWARSGGGVTASGGEPLQQAAGLQALLRLLGSRGHHRAVETSGAADSGDVRRIAPHVDLWLWDVKAVSPGTYRKGTGGEVNGPLSNLSWVLKSTETPVTVRVPLIPDFNLDEVELQRIALWLKNQSRLVETELLPGHSCGSNKGSAGSGQKSISVDSQSLEHARSLFEKNGIPVLRKPSGGFA